MVRVLVWFLTRTEGLKLRVFSCGLVLFHALFKVAAIRGGGAS